MKVDLFFLTRSPNAVQLYIAINMSDVAMVESSPDMDHNKVKRSIFGLLVLSCLSLKRRRNDKESSQLIVSVKNSRRTSGKNFAFSLSKVF